MHINELEKRAIEYGFAAAKAADTDKGRVVVLFYPYPFTETHAGKMSVCSYYVYSQRSREAEQALMQELEKMGVAVRPLEMPIRPIACKTGGAIGRNALYFEEGLGSAVVLRGFYADVETKACIPAKALSRCADCDRCIKACPTGAITEAGYTREKCLREYTDHTPMRAAGRKHVKLLVGCELCQRACPENAHVPVAAAPSYTLSELLSGEVMDELRTLIGANMARPMRIKEQALCHFWDADAARAYLDHPILGGSAREIAGE